VCSSPGATDDSSDKGAERTTLTQATTNDTRNQPQAETRTREQYADAMCAGGDPASRDNSQERQEAPEEGPRGQPEGRADHDRAEPRDRETYAEEVRTGQSAGEDRGPAATAAELPAAAALDSSSASNGRQADQAPEDHAVTWQQAVEALTLTEVYSAETNHQPDENQMVSSGEHPQGDQPGGRVFDGDQAATSAQDQQGTGHQPETITFDNKDVEVTHNAADGIWIEGLPGETPTRIGDLVRSAEDPTQGRGEKLRKELGKEAEPITDTAGKWADYVQEILDNPRPTHSMTHSHSYGTASAGAEQGINAGHGAEAFLTVAIVGAAVVHNLHERLQRAWHH
jgi:hypothetical protein